MNDEESTVLLADDEINMQPETEGPSAEDIVISNEILETLPHPAFCIDSRFSIAIANSRARELRIKPKMETLRSVLPAASIEEIAAALLPGGRRRVSPVEIKGSVWKIRIRPFCKTDALKAILFLDEVKPA